MPRERLLPSFLFFKGESECFAFVAESPQAEERNRGLAA